MNGKKIAEGDRFFDYMLGILGLNSLRDMGMEGMFAKADLVGLVEPKRGGACFLSGCFLESPSPSGRPCCRS